MPKKLRLSTDPHTIKTVSTFGESELTLKQQAFVNHPLALTDPSAAAKAAGYSDSFCTQSAHALRKELLFYIDQKNVPAVARQEIGRVEVLAELGSIATSNVAEFFEVIDTKGGGSLLAPKQNIKAMPVHIQKQIRKIEFETMLLPDGTSLTVISKIELYNKLDALKELVEILRLKQGPGNEKPPNPLLENIPTKDLAELRRIMERATHSVVDADNKSRDKNALPA